MSEPPEKSAYRLLRSALEIIKVLAIAAVAISILGMIIAATEERGARADDLAISGRLFAVGAFAALMAALAQVIIDIAERVARPQPILDALPVLKNIESVLSDLQEVQVLCSKNPQTVFQHARRYYGSNRFPEGEAIIALEAQTAFDYAADVIMRPFPAGEPAIAKNGALSAEYARKVLGGPFPAGEPAIRQDEEAKRGYEALVRAWAASQQKTEASNQR